jgi:hypothetical protein
VRLRKDDSFADRAQPYDPSSVYQRSPARFLRESDRKILKSLHQMPYGYGTLGGRPLSGEEGTAALEAIIATGRARWRALGGPVVALGPARKGRILWRLFDDGAHRPDLEPADPAVDGGRVQHAFWLAPPWWIDMATGEMGPVETDFPPHIAAGILSAPPVPAEQRQILRTVMARRLPKLAAFGPPDIAPAERIDDAAVPGLRLTAMDLPRFDHRYGWRRDSAITATEQILLARPFFRYGTVELRADEKRARPTFARDGRLVEIERDRAAERAAFGRLHELGFRKAGALRPYDLPPEHREDLMLAPDNGGTGWMDLLYRDAPALRAEGWTVEIDPAFPLRLVRSDADLSAELSEGSGIDWLELDLGILIDGERIDLVPALLPFIAAQRLETCDGDPDSPAQERPVYVPLPDGRILALPAARLRPLLAALHDLFSAGAIDAQRQRLRFSRLDAVGLADLEAATEAGGVRWQGGEQARQLGRLLRETGGIPRTAVPSSFGAMLRPYQARGVDWLQFLAQAGLGGVLADDMGLGKTVQTLAHLAIEKASGRMQHPALVVAPTSVLTNWQREAHRFAPDLAVLALHGADRKSRFGEIAAHDLVLTTYPLLARDHATLHAQRWHAVVLDEAQTIKNPNAATTRLVGQLDAGHRLCLTGTPLENHLGELWSLFAFLSPGFLGDRLSFNRRWRTPIEKKGDRERQRLLARRVRPFLLRRTKGEVAIDLPPKTEIVEPIEMEPEQRDLYESVRLAMHAKVREAIAAKGLARSHILFLDALLKLRQVCCDPRLVKKVAGAPSAPSAKLSRLMEMLPELIDEGRRVLLFSQFTSMLALIADALDAASISHVVLTGGTRDRDTPVRRFQEGGVPLFLISLKAGGLGLNLTAADTVVHYDPWWNPAVEDQATDRAHRIGQDKPVFIHKLMMLGSIEEKIELLKTRKRELAAGLFNPEAGTALDLTEADVDALLGPT